MVLILSLYAVQESEKVQSFPLGYLYLESDLALSKLLPVKVFLSDINEILWWGGIGVISIVYYSCFQVHKITWDFYVQSCSEYELE